MLDDYPGLSSFVDRHGTTRYRYRRKNKTVSLKGQPGDPEFEEAYHAAVEGRAPKRAAVVRMPGAALPATFGAAWRKVLASAEWKAFDPATKSKNSHLADMFLLSRVVPEDPFLWRDVPVADMRRRHLKAIIALHSETPHKAKHLLTAIRKMITAALDEEWIEVDPSYKLKWRPPYKGWKAWSPEAMAAFEKHWPIGSTPRLVYAVALWLGNRRGDVARLRKDARCTKTVFIDGIRREVDGFQIVQKKGGKSMFLPITPMMAECLDAIRHDGETVIVTAFGKPFSEKSITGRMADWTHAAGLEKGHTLHGLRKSLGVYLAESGASTRQLMDMLGHDDIAHAELYSREASQIKLAVQGMDRVSALIERGLQAG